MTKSQKLIVAAFGFAATSAGFAIPPSKWHHVIGFGLLTVIAVGAAIVNALESK